MSETDRAKAMFNQLKQVQKTYNFGGSFKLHRIKDTVKSQISSTETETEDEDMMPDLDRRSAVGAIEGEETLATSSDSLASLIPPEKKQSMQGRDSIGLNFCRCFCPKIGLIFQFKKGYDG